MILPYNSLCRLHLACRSFYPSELVSGKVSYPPNQIVSPAHIAQIIESMDAIAASGPPPYYGMDVEKTYKLWHDFAIGYKKDFVPYAWPGYYNMSCTTCKPVGGNAEHFQMLLDVSLRNSTTEPKISFMSWKFSAIRTSITRWSIPIL